MNQNTHNKTGCLFPFGDDIFPFLMFLFHQDELNQVEFGEYDHDEDSESD
jgi:hypothetical protein